MDRSVGKFGAQFTLGRQRQYRLGYVSAGFSV
jgi:hypothetical protein